MMFILKYKKSFMPNDTEIKRIRVWFKNHAKTCPTIKDIREYGWSGFSPIHYILTPHSAGTVMVMKCDCGEEVNATGVKRMQLMLKSGNNKNRKEEER